MSWSLSLATELMEAGNLVGAERAAHWALRLAPTDETSARGFIRTLAAAGARASAVRFYERLRVELARMLEVDPAPATAALEAALRASPAEPSAPRWQAAAGGLIHRFQGRPLAIRCRCRPSDHQRAARSPQAGQRNWSSRGPETRTI